MNIDINLRVNQLTSLQNYQKDVEKEVTMILQNLQWDRKNLAERRPTVPCQYDINHRVPPDKLMEHEHGCFLKNCGYSKGDYFLPSPVDPDATTMVKLCPDDIAKIINNASNHQPLFTMGAACGDHQPLTLERLQNTYTTDERRAIYNAVVNQVPSCHDLSDLAFVSSQDGVGKETRAKSKLEILAELRDMRRRRTKYRVAAKTRNYSDVLRDVISTQMDLYSQAHNSMAQVHTKTVDSNSGSVVGASNEKTTKHYDNTNHNIEGEISNSSKNTSNISLHSMHQEKYDFKERRHNESKYRIEHHKDNYYNKSKRTDARDNSPNSRRKSHKHSDRYESRKRHGVIEYNHKRKIRTKDKTKDAHYGYSEYHSDDRHNSNRRRKDHDQHRNTKLGQKYENDVDRQKRYDYKRK